MATRGATQEKILNAALALFNEQGTAQVTTNHVAAAAGISPGNLYYHYRNKEEIIRALVEDRIFPALNAVWTLPPDRSPTLDDLQRILHRHFELFWEYRFFREVLTLIRNDPSLGQVYRHIYEHRAQTVMAVFDALVGAGVLQPPTDPVQYREIMTACGVVISYWLSHLETLGIPIEPMQMQRGAELILRLLKPYLRPEMVEPVIHVEYDQEKWKDDDWYE